MHEPDRRRGAAAAGGSNRVVGTAGTVGRRQTTSFTVPGNQQWIETDINVRDGETLNFRVSGEVEYAPNARVNPAGVARRTPGGPDVPIPNAPAGALVGRIDNGQPFLIGRNTSVRMPANGTLFLGINDDNVTDNGGDFRVLIAR